MSGQFEVDGQYNIFSALNKSATLEKFIGCRK